MSTVDDIEKLLAPLRLEVKNQGDLVRSLKEQQSQRGDKSLDGEILCAVNELKAKKKLLENKELELTPSEKKFDRAKLEDLMKQRFVYDQSFSIYGGIQGLYDYGPLGCAIKANMLDHWRKFFILDENMYEVDCSILTPEPVLKASGHVDRFTDYMVKDVETGDCYRADHLIEASLDSLLRDKRTPASVHPEIKQVLAQLDNYKGPDLDNVISKFDVRSPITGNRLTQAQQYNLMFSTSIGPAGNIKGYLRPETAQGIFVNFSRLLQFNQGKLPFASAQIGRAFRNEISPRSGLIRVREFVMAEIEYFLDPRNKDHPKFEGESHTVLNLFSANDQMDGKSPRPVVLGDAVAGGMIANQTLGYFMGRIHRFMLDVGVDPARLRFRQHMSNEMAHYACDCWDAECLTSYGWVECVGCADRSCFDLTQHEAATGSRMVAEVRLDEPRTVHVVECTPNKSLIGRTLKKDAGHVYTYLAKLDNDGAKNLHSTLQTEGSVKIDIDGLNLEITKDMVQLKESDKIVYIDEITPNVIEPSFGIGRIMYTVFEHNFRIREGDENRTMLSLPPLIAPYKCSVLPLSKNAEFVPLTQLIAENLRKDRVSHRVDDTSGSIGRRYARTDQIAIPYGITIDFDSINKSPASVTLRERDSMKQIRVPVDDISKLVRELSEGESTWTQACAIYPIFEQQETGRDD